jgi:hypothetical protein
VCAVGDRTMCMSYEAALRGRRLSRFPLISDGECIAELHRIAARTDFLDQISMAPAEGVFGDVIKLGGIADADLPAQRQPIRFCGFGHNAPRADGRASVRPHAGSYLVRVDFHEGGLAHNGHLSKMPRDKTMRPSPSDQTSAIAA